MHAMELLVLEHHSLPRFSLLVTNCQFDLTLSTCICLVGPCYIAIISSFTHYLYIKHVNGTIITPLTFDKIYLRHVEFDDNGFKICYPMHFLSTCLTWRYYFGRYVPLSQIYIVFYHINLYLMTYKINDRWQTFMKSILSLANVNILFSLQNSISLLLLTV